MGTVRKGAWGLTEGSSLLRPALKAPGGSSFPHLSRGACPQRGKGRPRKRARASLDGDGCPSFIRKSPFVVIGSNAVSELVRLRKHFRCCGPFPVRFLPSLTTHHAAGVLEHPHTAPPLTSFQSLQCSTRSALNTRSPPPTPARHPWVKPGGDECIFRNWW